MSTVDLSALPAPTVLEPLDFEEVYQRKAGACFAGTWATTGRAALESDPVVKLLEVGAYISAVQNRARVNDAGKALLLAHADRADLDHLAANVNLQAPGDSGRGSAGGAAGAAGHGGRRRRCASGSSWPMKG